MPLYDFRNKETGEIVEVKMSYKDYDDYLTNNPHMERYHSVENFPAFGDSMRMSVPGIGQPDARFEREIIGRIKNNVAGNNLHRTHKTKAPREW